MCCTVPTLMVTLCRFDSLHIYPSDLSLIGVKRKSCPRPQHPHARMPLHPHAPAPATWAGYLRMCMRRVPALIAVQAACIPSSAHFCVIKRYIRHFSTLLR